MASLKPCRYRLEEIGARFMRLIIVLIISSIAGRLIANPWDFPAYERDYQEKGYTKFSDFIAKYKADKQYRYVEDYLELYRFNLPMTEANMLKNIANLRHALTLRFRSPYQSLCSIADETDYHKYRLLVSMHIQILITRNFLRLGALYDKRFVHFHDIAFADDLLASLKTAKLFYEQSSSHWQQAARLAIEASKIRRDLDLGTMESQRYDIIRRELDLGRMRKIYLYRLDKKIKRVEEMIAQIPS